MVLGYSMDPEGCSPDAPINVAARWDMRSMGRLTLASLRLMFRWRVVSTIVQGLDIEAGYYALLELDRDSYNALLI